MPTASFATLTGGTQNPNKNTLRVQSTVRNESPYEFEYITPTSKLKILTCKRENTELLAVDASSATGDEFSAGISISRLYTIQDGDVLSVNPVSENLDKKINVKIVVNGKTVFDCTLDSIATYQNSDKYFSYTVKDGDEIQVFWSTTAFPVAASTTATVVVNSTYEYDEDEAASLPDYVTLNSIVSLIQFNGSGNAGVDESVSGYSVALPVYSKSYTFYCGTNAFITITQMLRGDTAPYDANVKVTVNGIAIYEGVYRTSNSSMVNLISYTPKPGDLIVIDWIRIDEATQEPVVIDNPNKNTLWFTAEMGAFDDSVGAFGTQHSINFMGNYDSPEGYLIKLDNVGLDICNTGNTGYMTPGSVQSKAYTLTENKVLSVSTSEATNKNYYLNIIINGTTVYDGVFNVYSNNYHDNIVFSYTTHSGDEIYVRLEKVKEEPVSADTLLSTSYESYGSDLNIGIYMNGKLVEPTAVNTFGGDYVTYYWYVPHDAVIKIIPTNYDGQVNVTLKNVESPYNEVAVYGYSTGLDILAGAVDTIQIVSN